MVDANTSGDTATASETKTRHTGTVAKWLNHRGIGFITPDGQETEVGKDLLVHYAHIKQGDGQTFKSLKSGSKVEYEIIVDPKKPDKFMAVNVTGVGGGDCEKEDRRRRNRHRNNRTDENGGDGGGAANETNGTK